MYNQDYESVNLLSVHRINLCVIQQRAPFELYLINCWVFINVLRNQKLHHRVHKILTLISLLYVKIKFIPSCFVSVQYITNYPAV
jgi:hypothetical protein